MKRLLAAVIALTATSTYATPTTWTFGGSPTSTSPNGFNFTDPTGLTGTTLQARGYSYSNIQPLDLSLSTTLTSRAIRQDIYGLGVGGNGDGQPDQIDNNGALEVMKLTLGGKWSLKSIVLSSVEADDTLNLFGLTTDGTLERIGFGGVNTMIWPNGNENITSVTGLSVSCGNPNTCTISGLNTAYYSELWFAANRIGSDGYRLNAITAEVPEPAMLGLFGLGAIGLGLSRRRRAK